MIRERETRHFEPRRARAQVDAIEKDLLEARALALQRVAQ
jgi:hypothetical protein